MRKRKKGVEDKQKNREKNINQEGSAVLSTAILWLKKIYRKVHRGDKCLGSFFEKYAIGQVIIAIILALAVAGFSSIISTYSEESEYISSINSLCLGMNQSFVDTKLGVPEYLTDYDDLEITESIYTSRFAIVRCYYHNHKLVAYFVTGREGQKDKLGENGMIKQFTNNKKLGDYTFKEIQGAPKSIDGYISNGVGYTAYYETYYYGSRGLYNGYYFMVMDYGFDDCECIDLEAFTEDEEVSSFDDIHMGMPFYDRERSFPNTYGTSDGTIDIIGLATEYLEYDFMRFLGWLDND